jgi:hypothetical protein
MFKAYEMSWGNKDEIVKVSVHAPSAMKVQFSLKFDVYICCFRGHVDPLIIHLFFQKLRKKMH